MQLSKALTIEGWMEKAELEWLASQASTHRIIVEVGSFKGRSTRTLCDNTSGLVIAIDDFYGPREIQYDGRMRIYEQFLSNMAGVTNLAVIKADHRSLPEPEFTPDMVFIDGAHEYEAVKADIEYWILRIAKGGLLCGHDYGWCPGVNKAVDEQPIFAQVAPGTSIWFATIQ